MIQKTYLLLLLFLLPIQTEAQFSAFSSRKSWSIYGSAGLGLGMQEIASDIQFGLGRTINKWDVFGDIHLDSYSSSRVFRVNASMGKDLLRLKRLKRHPYHLFAYAGIGLTHLSNPVLFDSFLIRGDDMIHISLGIQPRYMITRTFGLISDINFNQNLLIDFQLKRSLNMNIGLIFKIY